MKKTSKDAGKKLGLKTSTVRTLRDKQISDAGGGRPLLGETQNTAPSGTHAQC